MIFHYLKERESPIYFEQLSLTLNGFIDIEKIKIAWNYVIKTNEILRSVFRWEKFNKPVQVILKHKEVSFKQYNLTEFSQSEKNARIRLIKENDKKLKIELDEDPFRITIIKLGIDNCEMIISYHHIILDGWSSGIIIKEFFDFYNSLCNNKKPKIINKNKYKNFIVFLQGLDEEKHKRYWRKYLQGVEWKTTLPVDNICLSEPNALSKFNDQFSISRTQSIIKFCSKYRVTIASFIYTVWGILLQKYNNCSNILFGTTVSGRTTELNEIENMVGLFINTIPMRIKGTGNESLLEILEKVEMDSVERLNFENTPLTTIIGLHENTDIGNLFNSVVVVENYPLDKTFNDPTNILRVEKFEMHEMTNYQLLIAVSVSSSINMDYYYNSEIFESETIERISDHFNNIILQILMEPTMKVRNLDIMAKNEKEKLLNYFNDTITSNISDKTIHELFEEQVMKTPNEIAVIFENDFLTYDELDKRANYISNIIIKKIKERNLAKNSVVALMTERSLDMIIGMLGILKAGCAYLPIDPQYPSERIEYMLSDSDVQILVMHSQLYDKLMCDLDTIFIDSIQTIYANKYKSQKNPKDLAYIIYTSGSTGKAKGVAVEHASIVNTLLWRKKYYQFGNLDRILQIPSFSFDSSVEDIFTPLISGARLILIKQELKLDISYLKDCIVKNKVTNFLIVPSFYKIMLREISKYLYNVKSVILAGDSFSEELVLEHFKKLKTVKLYNEYGPSENSVCTSVYEFKKDKTRVLIGKPISNTKCYILDKNDCLCPIGVEGELCLSGPGLARGYLNKPKLTCEKFVSNPFVLGERMYRTGDVARWLPDGNLEFLGRNDQQVKVRGYRIELKEVEKKLRNISGIYSAAVIIKTRNEEKYLVGYIAGEVHLTSELIRDELNKVLPSYLVPSYIIRISSMPVTINGKIDRKKLQKIQEKFDESLDYIKPRGWLDQKLVEIWKEVLSFKEDIGINYNFFEIGGHSLKAMTLVSKIHKMLNINIPIKEIFKRPTIEQLSNYIDRDLEHETYPILHKVHEKNYYPLSSPQRRLYIKDSMEGQNSNYNMSALFELKGTIEVDKLENSFRQLIKRHESLRTGFKIVKGEVVQGIWDDIDFKIECPQIKEANIESYFYKFVQPFNLDSPPLIRVALIIISEQKSMLIVDMHHIVSDAISVSIMIKEISKIYNGERLAPLSIQYKDYVIWQQKISLTNAYKQQEQYWLDKFSDGGPINNLFSDFKRPEKRNYRGGSISIDINIDDANKISEIARKNGTTVYIVLLAIFNVLLYKYTEQEDIAIGSPITGRNNIELHNMIGMFVNMIVMRNHPKADIAFTEFLSEVKNNALQAYENQDYQYEDLVDKLKLKRDSTRNPLFDIVFSFKTENDVVEINKLDVTPIILQTKISKFDLLVEAIEQKNTINIRFEYSTQLYKKETIERMKEHYLEIIKAVSENAFIQIKDIKLSHTFIEAKSIDFTENNNDYNFNI